MAILKLFFDLFLCLSLFSFSLYFQNIYGIMFVEVVLPSIVVNRIILIGSLPKKQMLLCFIYHRSTD
jgi:hypothetical protein